MTEVTDVEESWRDRHGMAYANGQCSRVAAGTTVIDEEGNCWLVLRWRDGTASLARELVQLQCATVLVE